MKRNLFLIMLFLLLPGVAFTATQTPNLNMTKPARGDSGWAGILNNNFDTLDTHVGGLNNNIDDLPEVERHTGTFNSTTGVAVTLSKEVDAINEYGVEIVATSRAGAIGDVWVSKGTSSFTVYCSEANTTDTFEAIVFHTGDMTSYGGSMYRRYYVSPSTSITDHSVAATVGSLAYVLAQMSGTSGIIVLPANRIYTLTANDVTIPAGCTLVMHPGVTISVGIGRTLKLGANVDLRGAGYNSLIYSTGVRTAAMLQMDGVTGVSISNVRFNANDDSQAFGQVEVTGNSSNITIENNHFSQGYAGIWIRPAASDTISDIKIINNRLTDLSHNIYIGENTGIAGETITDLDIIGNTSTDAKAGGDGLKLVQSVSDCEIVGNTFSGNSADGVDLFASGDSVVLTANIIKNNGVNGIDIKSDLTGYPASTWGEGKHINIANNIIHSNSETGVKIWKATDGEWPYMIGVENNQIYNNDHYGVACRGHHVDIVGNKVFGNGRNGATNFSGIYVNGLSTEYAENIIIANNIVSNNGESSRTNTGILISSYINRAIVEGNIITNDSALANDEQNWGLYVNVSTTNIIVRNNKIDGHTTNVSIDNGAGVSGETIAVNVGSIAAGTIDEVPIFTPLNKTCLLSAYLVNASGITQSDADYTNLSVRDRGSDGTATNTIFGVNTSVSTGVGITAFDALSMGNPNATWRFLDPQDVVTLVKSDVGNGAALDHAVVVLNYIDH